MVDHIATGVIANVLNQTSTAGFTVSGGAASRTKINTDTLFGGVAVDPDDDTLYVSDTNNHRVLRIAPSGLVTQVAGTSSCITTSARCMTGPPSAMATHDGNDGVDMARRWRTVANRPSTGR